MAAGPTQPGGFRRSARLRLPSKRSSNRGKGVRARSLAMTPPRCLDPKILEHSPCRQKASDRRHLHSTLR